MIEQKNTELTWWERNKKKVFIIGGVVIAAGIGIVVFKNKDALLALRSLTQNRLLTLFLKQLTLLSQRLLSRLHC